MAQGKDRQGLSEGEMLMLLLVLLGGIFLAWYLAGAWMSRALAWMRYQELWVFSALEGARQLRGELPKLDFASMKFSDFQVMASVTGAYTRWLFAPPLIALGVWLYLKSPRQRFSSTHTMSSLARSQAELWPEIGPVAGRQEELVKLDQRAGPWASAMTEWEFAEKFKLAKPGEPASLDKARAREVFAAQLGSRWPGANGLPKHTRAIYACLLLYVAGERDKGQDAFRQLAKSFVEGKPELLDDSFAAGAIAKHGKHMLVAKTHEQHAYTYTVLATLLQLSRTSGVVASPMFLWLKTVDRRLWYMLNNVGRYAFHIECAGIAAHWLFEKSVGVAVTSPMVDKAVEGLASALTEYTKDDELERIFR